MSIELSTNVSDKSPQSSETEQNNTDNALFAEAYSNSSTESIHSCSNKPETEALPKIELSSTELSFDPNGSDSNNTTLLAPQNPIGESSRDLLKSTVREQSNDANISERLVEQGELISGPLTLEGSINSIQPNLEEISQGKLGDCYFIAAIQAVANSPQGVESLKNMIKHVDGPEMRGDALEDVFEVSFPGAEKPIRVSLSELNSVGAMQTDGDHNDRYNADGLWMRILEGAAGKHLGAKLGVDMSTLEFPSDALPLKGDPRYALTLLTGKESSGLFINNWNTMQDIDNVVEKYKPNTIPSNLAGTGEALKVGFRALFTTRPPHNIESDVTKALESGNLTLLAGGNHAYTVLDIEKGETPGESLLVIRNPWGRQYAETQHDYREYSDGTKDGVLKVPIKDAKKMFLSYYITKGDKS